MTKMSFETRQDFRTWLAEKALSNDGIWLTLDKRKNAHGLTAAEALRRSALLRLD